jgi:tetratricopeptide (TPR) repeat protein
MLKPQKSISKKEIKEDRLVTTYFQSRKWIDENKRIAGYIIAAPFLIALVWFFWNQKVNDWNDEASTMLSKIAPYYDEGRYELAINGVPQEGIQGLQTIVDLHGSTHTGQFAKLYLANSYFAMENYDKALEYYDAISVSDKMITASALAGMAACYEVKGDVENAASYYEKAASKNMVSAQAPENLQRAAVNYAASGKKEKAVEILQTIKRQFPASSYARDVDMYIAEYSS